MKYLYLCISIALTSVGHILLKISISGIKGFDSSEIFLSIQENFKHVAILLFGFLSIIVSFVFWIIALKYFKVSIAFAMSSLSFLFVAVVGHLFLGENLSFANWIGIVFIMVGVVFLNYN